MKLRANIVKSCLKRDAKNLTCSLDLQMKEIPSIENLPDFVPSNELLHLDLSYNYLKKIESTFSCFSNLKWLDLSANHITDIKNLDYLSSLEYLNLSTNKISKIENMSSLLNLSVLDLSMNYIEKIENMNLPKLESLNLTGNQIINLENLEGLINLKELDISKNKIDKLDYLSTDGVCNDLLILKCNYSNIEFQYLGKLVGVLQNLIYLEEIEFIGNQITLNSEYKCIFSKVLTLKSIDGVQISNTQKQHLKDIKLDEELEYLNEKVQEEYLHRIRDEHENKMNYKNLINDRRNFIESVFDDYEDSYNKDLNNFVEFTSDIKKQKPNPIKSEILNEWKNHIVNDAKERDRLTKLALKHQEEIKQNFLNTKIKSTKLTQKLYEISMTQPEAWKNIKKRELEQIHQEENEQIKKDREIPREESEENEDDLIDILEEEFKHDVANILSDKIREIQTKDLQKERGEAVNVIKKTFKQHQNNASPKKYDLKPIIIQKNEGNSIITQRDSRKPKKEEIVAIIKSENEGALKIQSQEIKDDQNESNKMWENFESEVENEDKWNKIKDDEEEEEKENIKKDSSKSLENQIGFHNMDFKNKKMDLKSEIINNTSKVEPFIKLQIPENKAQVSKTSPDWKALRKAHLEKNNIIKHENPKQIEMQKKTGKCIMF